ncbi:MAG: uracil phosphoribosyltransferase [Planctomycetota bacterium]|nr:uracil phosphoribosyltransferase [Planctomycetota bacterium]MDP6941501.1 uracil phosphoribosyltransferase [Planctomycetota bacterium]
MVVKLASGHPLVQDKISRLRETSTPSEEFRRLVKELSLLLGVEATQDLETTGVEVTTPLTTCTTQRISTSLALVPILRAGLGMLEGLSYLLPQAEIWHLGLYRDEESLQPVEYYNKLPQGAATKSAYLLDPMLATGGSAIAAVDVLKKWGCSHIRFLGILGAPEGVEALEKAHPDVEIHLCALDSHLNELGYIVPGLGDAGDRQFNTLSHSE